MSSIKISAVIITFNEEKNIARCLESLLPVADEIIVLDSHSTDLTKDICAQYNAHFHQHHFDGHVQQKNRALALASYEWVLALDADEVVSDRLKDSIVGIKNNSTSDAYSFNRLTYYCGSWIHHCGWYPNRRIRLWKKQLGRWGGVNPHDSVRTNPGIKVGHLKGDLLHYSFHSVSDHLKQLDKFTTIASQEALKRNKKVYPLIHIVLYPFATFLRMYFLRLGFLDGMAGFMVCISASYYRFMKYSKLYFLYKESRHSRKIMDSEE